MPSVSLESIPAVMHKPPATRNPRIKLSLKLDRSLDTTLRTISRDIVPREFALNKSPMHLQARKRDVEHDVPNRRSSEEN